ncbi:MAG: EF-hand domain-containing protein [Lysobacterales bacterium]|jgi:hypothetical protein
MNKPSRFTFFALSAAAALALAITLPSTVFAAHHGQPPGFADFDTDGDGFVSEEEFLTQRAERMKARAEAGGKMKGQASAPSFGEIDSNGDGKLDEAEFVASREAHMKAMRERHGKGGGQHGGRHGGGMKMPGFSDLDLDGNGCIDADEFAKHQAAHHGKRHGASRDAE